MDKRRYIKVTPKGSDKSHVVLATNEAFYKSQGAKIDEPTAAEIVKYFPEEGKDEKKPKVVPVEETDEYKALAIAKTEAEAKTANLETKITEAETKATDLETALATAKTEAEAAKTGYEAEIKKLEVEIAKLKKA